MLNNGILGSLLFGSNKPKSTSTLTPNQQGVSNALTDFFLGKLNKNGQRAGGLLANDRVPNLDRQFGNVRQLLSLYSPQSSIYGQNGAIGNALGGQPSYDVSPQATQDYFQKNLYQPALQSFDQYIAPRIRESFAGPSNALTSRSGTAVAQSLGDLTTGLNAQMAQAVQQNQQLQAQLNDSARQRQLQGAMLPAQAGIGIGGALQPFQQNAFAQSPAGNPFFSQSLGFLNNSQMALYQPQSPISQMSQLAMLAALA
jgi:hypothetical protein